MKRTHHPPDYILIGTLISLLLVGILMITSSSTILSQEKFGTTYYFLKRQVLFGIIPGVILGFFASIIPLGFLKKWIPALFLINLILLAMVFLTGFGSTFGGAARWISVGPISFQPSEFLKLTFIIYLASWLTGQTSIQKKSGFWQKEKKFTPILIAFLVLVGLISLFLIFQPDISSLGIIVFSAVLLYFLAGTPLWHTILMILMGAGSLFTLIKLAPYRLDRLLVFLKPETDPMGIGYQIKQALIAVGSGGIFGLGLGMSRQKFGFLPHTFSDSIFAIFAEETGFLGSLILIILFLIFFWRVFKISKKTQDKFSQLTALGIGSWIILQAFVNIGSMIGILPLSGIPLPFISYGGSHLVVELIGAGILLNISKSA